MTLLFPPGCPPLVEYIYIHSRFSFGRQEHISLVEPGRRVEAVLGDQRSAPGKLAVNPYLRGVIDLDGFGRVAYQEIPAHGGNLLRSVFCVTL